MDQSKSKSVSKSKSKRNDSRTRKARRLMPFDSRSRLGGRSYQVREEPVVYENGKDDFDFDPDFDLDKGQPPTKQGRFSNKLFQI